MVRDAGKIAPKDITGELTRMSAGNQPTTPFVELKDVVAYGIYRAPLAGFSKRRS
jgi:hypothetical protein